MLLGDVRVMLNAIHLKCAYFRHCKIDPRSHLLKPICHTLRWKESLKFQILQANLFSFFLFLMEHP